MTHHTHAELVRELTSRWPEHRVAPSLSRVAALMELLGDPQRAMPVIQVADTNGKGSTAVMIETVLRAAGLRYGAVDLRRTPAGDHVFLEINPAGQWLFVEEKTGQPMTEAMARLLAGLHEEDVHGDGTRRD